MMAGGKGDEEFTGKALFYERLKLLHCVLNHLKLF